LFGEQIQPSDFRITDLSVQKKLGSFAQFVVDVVQAARDAATFFTRTSHKYTVFNYLGEWHSHPSFAVQPSSKDKSTMRELVSDADFHGNFAVLMITKLEADRFAADAWVYDREGNEANVALELEA
jgi:[CysO sulfur-carrier protein]-S-L-cysteine hydrolase